MLVCDASQSRLGLRFETQLTHSKHALTEIYNTNVLVTFFPAPSMPQLAAEILGRAGHHPTVSRRAESLTSIPGSANKL